MTKKTLEKISLILVILGGLNLGLIGLGGWNLIDLLLGSVEWLAKTMHIVIGLAALYLIYYAAKK